MIECPSCGRQHRPGTLFCSECGVYLPTGGPLRTEPLPEEELPASRANPWATTGSDGEGAEKTAMLRIIMAESGRQVQLPVVSEIYLGRLDGCGPKIKLNAFLRLINMKGHHLPQKDRHDQFFILGGVV